MFILMRLCYFVIMLGLFGVMIYSFLHLDKKLYKFIVLPIVPVFLCLLFLGTGNHTRKPNVNEESVNCVREYLSGMSDSNYKFETESISGEIYINSENKNKNDRNDYLEHIYVEGQTVEGVTDSGIKYVFSPVKTGHDSRFWNLYYPTGATGQIYIFVEDKCLRVDYLYIGENPYDFLNGIIDPTYFYCPEINVKDILRSAVVSEDKGYYG